MINRPPITIAYVEDDPKDVEAMRSMLSEWHIINPVVAFPTGWELLASLKAAIVTPGIVLVDMVMPSMDGLEVIRALRKDHASALPDVPLVMVTGMDDKPSISLAKSAGADAYIVKPVGVPALMKAINTVEGLKVAPFVLEIVRSRR